MSKSVKLVLKKDKKLDLLVHPDTNLVFKSATERVVTGRIADGEFVALDEEALKLCEENGFKYDESLVEEEEEVEEVADDAEEVKETPKVVKPEAKSGKSKPVKVAEEPAEEPEEKVVAKPVEKSKATAKPVASGLAELLERHAKEVSDVVSAKSSKLEAQVAELTEQLSAVKKELDEVKKKNKGLTAAFAAMQG